MATKIPVERFNGALRAFAASEIAPHLSGALSKFVLGAALTRLDVRSLPMIGALGVIDAEGGVDLDALDEMLAAGFKSAGGKISVDLPDVDSLSALFGAPAKTCRLSLSAADWDALKAKLAED